MKFACEIQMNNAAFEDQPATELARILRDVIRRVQAGTVDEAGECLRDSNGNLVGFAKITN